MKKLKFKRYYSLELARNRTACQSGGKIHTSVWPLKLIPSSYPRLWFHSLFHSEILSLVNFRAAIYMGQIIQHLRTISLNMNWRDPGILHSRNFVVIDEQCGAGSAKPWLDWMSQPEAVPRKPAILQWLPPYGGPPLVSSENAEGGLAWHCSSRLGGQRPGMDTDAPAIVLSLFPVIQPSVMYYSTQSVFWRFNLQGIRHT